MSPDTAIAAPPRRGNAAPPGLSRSPGQSGGPPFAALLARQAAPKASSPKQAPPGKAPPQADTALQADSVPQADGPPDAKKPGAKGQADPTILIDPAQMRPGVTPPLIPSAPTIALTLQAALPAKSAPPKTEEAMDTAPAPPRLGAAKPPGSELLPSLQPNTGNEPNTANRKEAVVPSGSPARVSAPNGQPPVRQQPASPLLAAAPPPIAPAAAPVSPALLSGTLPAALTAQAQTGLPSAPAPPALKKAALPANNTGRSQAAGPVKQSRLGAEPAKDADPGPAHVVAGAKQGAASSGKPAGEDASASDSRLTIPAAPAQPEREMPQAAPAAIVSGQTAPATSAATQTALPALTPAERASALHQVADAVSAMPLPAAGGHGQMTLQLHPQDWGSLHLSVAMTPAADGSGTQIVAHVVAENGAVRDALELHGHELRQALQDAGLHLERLTVTVQDAGEQTVSAGDPSQSAAQNGFAGQGAPKQWDTPPQQSSPQAGGVNGGNGESAFSAFAQGQGGSAPRRGNSLPKTANGRTKRLRRSL